MRLTFRAKLMAIVGIAALAFVLLIVASGCSRTSRGAADRRSRSSYLPKVELEPQLEGQFERLRRGFQDAVAATTWKRWPRPPELEAAFLVSSTARARPWTPRRRRAARRLEAYYAAAHDVSRRLIADETGEAVVDAIAAMQAKQAGSPRSSRSDALRSAELAAPSRAAPARRHGQAYRLWISVACLLLVPLLSCAGSAPAALLG